MIKRNLYLVGMILFLTLASGSASRAEVPEWIPPAQGDLPIWISAEEARKPDGDLRWELFSRHHGISLKEDLKTASRVRIDEEGTAKSQGERCHVYSQTVSGLDLGEYSFASLLEHARLAVVGRVMGEKQGFYHGSLASLFEVEVTQVLKAPAAELHLDRVYFTFGHAEIPADGEMLCVRNQHYPHRPMVGGRIVVFAANIPDWEPLIIAAHQDELFFEYADSKVSMSQLSGQMLDQPDWSFIVEQLARLPLSEAPRGRERDQEVQP